MKQFRKTIRVNGKEVKGPRFKTQADAQRWYDAKKREKVYLKEGLHLPIDDKKTLSGYFDDHWFTKRKDRYPESTYFSDEQRFEKYVRPTLGPLPVAKINQLQIRSALRDVIEVHKMSIETRNRVRALLSKIFNDAMNERRPLRSDNPALNISFDDPRTGKKPPQYVKTDKEILAFMKAAKALGSTHFAYACIALMAGLRKSEIIPLVWRDFDEDEKQLILSKRFMQAAHAIRDGLKSGSRDERPVPIPDDLIKVLRSHRKSSDFNGDDDFILVREDGECIKPRELHTIHADIRESAGVRVTPHGLRHTYGRQFALKSGNMKVLQAILGHSSSSTTELYSKLAGRTAQKHRNTVSFSLDDEPENE